MDNDKKKNKRHGKTAIQKQMNFSEKTVLAIAILAFLAFIMLITKPNTVYDIKEYDLKVTVGDKVGINLNTTSLDFGIKPGFSSKRELIIENNLNKTVRVELLAYGEIKKLVVPGENDFVIDPLSKKTVTIIVKTPESQALGDYTGTLKAIFKSTW